MVKVFYDTEFNENGSTIDLISFGAVDETGREFYAISTEFNPIAASPWVRDNVLAKLPPRSDPAWKTRLEIRDELHRWLIEPGGEIELWAYYAAYDHVAFAQLWGPMAGMPGELPWQTDDLMTLWKLSGRPEKPPQPADQHHALADAHWNRALYGVCCRMGIMHGPPGGLIQPDHSVIRGEHGPELVDLPPGGAVHTNDDTGRLG